MQQYEFTILNTQTHGHCPIKREPISNISSVFSQLYPILCEPMDCSIPGLRIHHQLSELLKLMSIDAIQTSHPLSSLSPPALNLSQHQGLLK